MKTKVLTALMTCLLLAGAEATAREKKLGEGDGVFRPVALGALLEVPLQDTLGPAQRAQLGLAGPAVLTLGAIPGDLVVAEFFNTSCYACALMAPVMDEVWRRVDARPALRERVRFIGVGVGNTAAQVAEFHARYDTPFPMVADPEFAAFDALGTLEGTPYLLLLRRGADGSVFGRAQVGHVSDPGRVVAAIEAALADAPPEDPTPREQAGAGWRTLRPPLSDDELQRRLVVAAAGAGLAGATATRVALPEGEVFYRLGAGERTLWALVAGRAKVCNVCHDIFFIVVFDGAGRVVNLEPIAITKYKNVALDEKDLEFLRSRVVGRLLTRDLVFDPSVDAVSQATMSTALIFDTLRRLGEEWSSMVKKGAVKP